MIHPSYTPPERGFVLFMTLITISVVVAVTLTTLNLSLKQDRLAADARDGEIAFHAANAGIECLQLERSRNAADFESGGTVNLECLGGSSISPTSINSYNNSDTRVSGDGTIYEYRYRHTWGPSEAERCSEVAMLVFNTDSAGSGLELSQVSDFLPGYPRTDNKKECAPGGLCTVLSSRGYSRDCPSGSDPFPIGTVQRDILSEF